MPRHPPCALDNLTNTPTPVTQSSSKPKTTHNPDQRKGLRMVEIKKKDARVHSALDNHTRRPPPAHPDNSQGSSDDCPEKHDHPPHPFTKRCEGRVVLSGPNSVPTPSCICAL